MSSLQKVSNLWLTLFLQCQKYKNRVTHTHRHTPLSTPRCLNLSLCWLRVLVELKAGTRPPRGNIPPLKTMAECETKKLQKTEPENIPWFRLPQEPRGRAAVLQGRLGLQTTCPTCSSGLGRSPILIWACSGLRQSACVFSTTSQRTGWLDGTHKTLKKKVRGYVEKKKGTTLTWWWS